MLIEVKEVDNVGRIGMYGQRFGKKTRKVIICECDFCHIVFEHVSRDNHPTRVIAQKEHFCCREHMKAHMEHLTPEDLLTDSEKFKDDEAYQEYIKKSMAMPIFVVRRKL